MTASFFILTLFITTIFSKTFICNDPICDFGICTNNKCTDNTYICTSSATHCQLECANCNNITIISSAEDTEILCDYKNCCNKISIEIQSKPSTDHNSLVLTCSHSTSCTDINILCNNQNNLCQCKDFDDIQCNTNVNGNFSLWHSHPSIIRTSLMEKNVTNQTVNVQLVSEISTSDISTTDVSTSAAQITSVYIANMDTNNAQKSAVNNTDTMYQGILIMFVVLFCISVCIGIWMYCNKWVTNISAKVNMMRAKKKIIYSKSPTSQNLPIPTLASSPNSAVSIISMPSQSSLDIKSPKTPLNIPSLQMHVSGENNCSNDGSLVVGV